MNNNFIKNKALLNCELKGINGGEEYGKCVGDGESYYVSRSNCERMGGEFVPVSNNPRRPTTTPAEDKSSTLKYGEV